MKTQAPLILLVEDNLADARLVSEALRETGDRKSTRLNSSH